MGFDSWEIMLSCTAVVGVWMLMDWWRVERHQPYPDEHETQHWERDDVQ